ncbi:MAG: hypothetical protein ABIQ51_08360 [Mesorhizobium sp.]
MAAIERPIARIFTSRQRFEWLASSTSLPNPMTRAHSSPDIQGTISQAMCLIIMSTIEPHGLLTPELAAHQRIEKSEFALTRSEEMVAENIAMCARLRSEGRLLAKAREPLTKIDPTRTN